MKATMLTNDMVVSKVVQVEEVLASSMLETWQSGLMHHTANVKCPNRGTGGSNPLVSASSPRSDTNLVGVKSYIGLTLFLSANDAPILTDILEPDA